jgi:hypothetical protein
MTRLLIQVFEGHLTLLFSSVRVWLWILKILKSLVNHEVGTGVNFEKMQGRKGGRRVSVFLKK